VDAFKPVTSILSPPGLFDARSTADQQATNSHFWRQNLETTADGKLKTATGFIRPYSQYTLIQTNGTPCPYSNWDYHMQDGNPTQKDLEVPTLLFPATDNAGSRWFYMGTKSRFLLLDEAAGTWSVIGSGFGVDGVASKVSTRWKAAQLQNNIYLTNGFDKVQYHTIGSGTMQEVTNLQTAGENSSNNQATAVTNPLVIVKYSGVIMLMNLEEGGVRVPSRIRWSDLNDGTYWGTGTTNPATGATSIADYQDLDYGDRILGAIEHLGYLYVFTDRSIWRCSFTVSGDPNAIPSTLSATLNCQRIYSEPKNKSRCLWYPNTLVSTGQDIFYAGTDAVYRFNLYMAVPERTAWIYSCSNIVFNEGINGVSIDQTSCNSPVMEYWPDRKEIHFSWPVPDVTFVGAPSCVVQSKALNSGLNRYTLVINTEWQTCDYRDYGMSCFANFQSNISQAGACAGLAMFFGASTADFCIKQFGTGYAREFFEFTGGGYNSAGYTPLFRFVFPFDEFTADKIINDVLLDAYAPGADGGSLFQLRTGMSFTQMNPNSDLGNCGVVWRSWRANPVKCLMTMPPEQYAAKNLKPAIGHRWKPYQRGRFLYGEISVTDSKGQPPVSGGVVFTRLETKAIDA
jgi:hypothetical protein